MPSGILNPTLAIVIIAVALLTGSLSILRDLQVMYVPARAAERRTFWGWVRVAFVLAAVLCWYDERSKVSELLDATQAAFLASSETTVAAPYYHVGGNWVLSDTCRNTSNTVIARSVTCPRWMTFADESREGFGGMPFVLENEQERAYKAFRSGLATTRISSSASKADVNERDLGPGEGEMLSMVSQPIDKALDEDFRGGRKTVMFLAEYNWRDGRGPHVREVCKWLQLPPELFAPNGSLVANTPLIWHACEHHDGLVPDKRK